MIKIDQVHIGKFRGILDLVINLDGKNFAVCGPNGTGKSGVVDAIEFALSGEISRLSGKNRGSVSVKKHAPHVDYRDRPSDVQVKLSGEINETGEKFSITRTVEDLNDPVIVPDRPSVKATLAELGRHRNSTLSRRELIEYVLSTPGNRAEQIQALLQLNFLRETRQTLQKIARARETKRQTLEQERQDASRELAVALGIPTLKSDELIAQVNARRVKLGLPTIPALEAQTSVKDGLSVVSEKAKVTVSKAIALTDLQSTKELFDNFTSATSTKRNEELARNISDLKETGEYEKGVERQDLLNRALNLVDDEKCPVCDTSWKPEDLIALLKEKLLKLEATLTAKEKLTTALEPVATEMASLGKAFGKMASLGSALEPKAETGNIELAAERLGDSSLVLREAKELDRLSETFAQLHAQNTAITDELGKLSERVSALPDTSERDAARDFLVEVDVRLGAYREARRKEQKATTEAGTAKIIFDVFKKTYEIGLNKIYSEIQGKFAELYREINKEDEAGFEAEMPIQAAGVGLDVDFYGRGKFPPGAYHSEGHQDGMGLCLYLALMDHLYSKDFKFCVLDDVLMSVDSSHRRAVCSMLGKEFPDTQFVFTTHDEVWLKNMQSTGLVEQGSVLQFRNWSVEGGPSEWIPGDIWNEIDQLVTHNDIREASAKMRHYLEYLAGELCHELGASVTYRGDHRYALGQLMPNATGRLAKLLRRAKTAAASWKNDELLENITTREDDLKARVAATKCEEWGVNAMVHYNEGANLSKEDFQPIVDAFKSLDSAIRCENCGSLIFVRPHFGKEEELRCKCGKVHINLTTNTAAI